MFKRALQVIGMLALTAVSIVTILWLLDVFDGATAIKALLKVSIVGACCLAIAWFGERYIHGGEKPD